MDKQFDITNTSNYNQTFEINDYSKIISLYQSIIIEFIKYAIGTIFIQKKSFLLYILTRGVDTINHCFIQLFMYTKNLNLT